ncbi:MAG TPA: PD-(D/E)XK nuclease family protein, partial [Actinomycetota bacterium]|nr:PD-(D/E)XK nuclease family protein [Actinomycetota bacterium]
GLEFDQVFIPGLARQSRSQIFPDIMRQANPATSARYIPFELRGDNEVLPRFMGNLSAFTEELKVRAEQEERRLFYVALTRAKKRVVCSGAYWYYPSGMFEALQSPMGLSEYWKEIRAFPDVTVIGEAELPEENPLIERRALRARNWPPAGRRAPDPLFPHGIAEAVKAARETSQLDETLFPVDSLPSGPPVPRALPVSAVVTYATCPKKFYWSYVRPLPRRPSSAARVGTIVHAFIEQHGKGQISLYDPEEFEEREPGEESARIAELKEAYKGSRFPGMKLVAAERAFTLVIDDVVVQGRIDAIFEREDGGWEIVDFKTGRTREPDGPERWQLDLYALAAQEIWGRAHTDLTLTFAYIGSNDEQRYEARPASELRDSLAVTLKAIAAGSFDPAVSPACEHCDFRRDCAEGRAFLAR